MRSLGVATNFIYSANETIRDADIEATAPFLQIFGTIFKLGGAALTLGVVTMIVLVIVLWYALNHTAWGRHLYAVGDDPEAAKLAGIRTDRVLLTGVLIISAVAIDQWIRKVAG